MNKLKNTKYVNLVGGPGVGKSSTALSLTGKLKHHGRLSEYIHEYAKDLTWRKENFKKGCQPYIAATQLEWQFSVFGQVEFAITDTSLLLSLVDKYQGFGCTEHWKKGVLEQFGLFDNIVILMERDAEAHEYKTEGRTQTLEEACEIDKDVENLLVKYGIEFIKVKYTEDESHVQDLYDLLTRVTD